MTTDPFMVQYIVENCQKVDYVTLSKKANVTPKTAVNIIKRAGLWEKCVRPVAEKMEKKPREKISTEKKKEKTIKALTLDVEKTDLKGVEILPPVVEEGRPKHLFLLSREEIVSMMAEQAVTELALFKAAVERSKGEGGPAAMAEATVHQKLAQSALVALGRWAGLDRTEVMHTVKAKLSEEDIRNMNLTELLNQGE